MHATFRLKAALRTSSIKSLVHELSHVIVNLSGDENEDLCSHRDSADARRTGLHNRMKIAERSYRVVEEHHPVT